MRISVVTEAHTFQAGLKPAPTTHRSKSAQETPAPGGESTVLWPFTVKPRPIA